MKYKKEIDGLRTLAVMPVVFYHAGFSLFKGGFIGVDIFFVISGFLITTILVNEKLAGTYSILSFYERRARRILPALYFMMAVTVLAAWIWLLPVYMESFARSIMAVPLFLSNFLFSLQHGYFDTGAELKPLLHTWSLAVEEQYYVLFPLLLTSVWKLPRKWIFAILLLIALFSLVAAQLFIVRFPSVTYFLLPTRAWEILLGALLAFITYSTETTNNSFIPYSKSKEVLSLCGLAAIFWAIFMFDEHTRIPGFYALLPTIGAILVIQFATERTIVGRFLGTRLMVRIGLISYSVYLWHQPLFSFARHICVDEPSRYVFLLLVFLSLLCGYLSWRFVEMPFRDRNAFGRKRIFQLAILGGAIFIIFGLAGHLTHGFPVRYSKEIRAVLLVSKDRIFFLSDGCHLEGGEYDLRKCIKGDKTVKPGVAIVGDSHAAALVYELDKEFAKNKLSFEQYTKDGCPFLVGLEKMPGDNCILFQHSYMKDFDQENIKTFVISSRWAVYLSDQRLDNNEGGKEVKGVEQYTIGELSFSAPFALRRAALIDGMRASLESLLKSGKNLILVYPAPEQGWDVTIRHAKILMLRGQLDKDISISSQLYRDRNVDILKMFDALDGKSNLIRVHPEQIFCDSYVEGRCLATYDNQQFYFDDNHLSNDGAHLVVEKIIAAVKKFEKN